MTALRRTLDAIAQPGHWVGKAAVLALMVLVSVDVLWRYAFDQPMSGTPDIASSLLLPALVFLPLAYSARDGHIRITLALSRVPGRIRMAISSIGHLAAAGLWLAIAYRMWLRTLVALEENQVPVTAFGLPPSWSYGIVALGALLMGIASAGLAVSTWAADRPEGSPDDPHGPGPSDQAV